MATSRKPRPAASLVDQALALAAGAWVELGVSGWTSTHQDWAIDVEPLLLFTAWLGDADPRLRDEATDWCLRNWRHVSKARLKNMLRRHPAEVQERFGEFAATVNAHTGASWPAAAAARRYSVTGRSAVPPLDRPSVAWLRLRAMFGVGARAEVLRSLLSTDASLLSAAALADATGYTKRNVADECDLLGRAGVLSVRQQGNRFYYSLARRAQLEAFVGDIAPIRPSWTALFDITRELVTVERLAATGSSKTLPVHVRSALRRIEDALHEVRIEPPPADVTGPALWPATQQIGRTHLGAWAVGRWPAGDRRRASRA